MKRILQAALWVVVPVLLAASAWAQASPSRDATREQLRATLLQAGSRSDVGVTFQQSTKNPYNFVGLMKTGLVNAESFEIVISVTQSDTIGMRVYPHYKGGYMNVSKAVDREGFMRRLLLYSDQNFLFCGADEAGDAFFGYTFTLESGYPNNAVVIVLRSIRNSDKFVGQLRTFYDGSKAP
jgi:hypothetical protein